MYRFVQADAQILCEVFARDDLSVHSEHEVYHAVMRWVTGNALQDDISANVHLFDMLIQHVRFPMLDCAFLDTCVKQCSFYIYSETMRQLIADAYRWIQSTPLQKRLLYVGGTTQITPRQSYCNAMPTFALGADMMRKLSIGTSV